ncbi:hypothetical protein AMELA_G00270590 [Ameiurus melas]|uniref:Uncharacterized protein n=1 Tax=Ameiurus melas TaxID=219545 RepID=A0A7J5ZNT7_AMEME|nr:hypothetical protein AMELA_G00270590 [Ameiurus melas]
MAEELSTNFVYKYDSLELHMVLLELEDVERRIRGLLDQQAQLQERRTALESSCASVHTPKVNHSVVFPLPAPLRRVFLCAGIVQPGLSQPQSPSHRRQHTWALGEPAAEGCTPGEGLATTGVPDSNPEPLRPSPPDQTQRRDRRRLYHAERPCSFNQR